MMILDSGILFWATLYYQQYICCHCNYWCKYKYFFKTLRKNQRLILKQSRQQHAVTSWKVIHPKTSWFITH